MHNVKKIAEYIESGCNQGQRLGLELEHFICTESDGAVSYEQVVPCLSEMQSRTGSKPYSEHGNLLGFLNSDYSVCLEPGCQLEISISPQTDPIKIEDIYRGFRKVCDRVLSAHGMKLVERGIHPGVEASTVTPDELPLLPKLRYKYMDAYFAHTGKMGRYMMRATASTQVSVDFGSMEDAMKMMRVFARLSPFIALLTENRGSIRNEDVFEPFLLRSQVWQDVDGRRCGYFPGCVREDYSFEKYAEYIYNTPCILLQKGDTVTDMGDLSAARYFENRELDTEEHLLSMFFPTVRLKKYLEYRVADSMPIERAIGYAAFIGKIAYDKEVLNLLDEATAHITDEKDIIAAEKTVFTGGYSAEVYGKSVYEWLWFILDTVMDRCTDKEASLIKRLITLPLLNYRYAGIIRGNEDTFLPDGKRIKDYLLSSTAKYHNRVVRTLYIPKLFTKRETAAFKRHINTLFGIFKKVIAKYEANPGYRALFGFDKRLEELILREKRYTCDIPMARIDIFHNDETGEFKFCEFNTDGSSAMNEDRELNNAFSLSQAHGIFTGEYPVKTCELFDTWVKEVASIYKEFSGGDRLPGVAIVDFMESATTMEFEIFRSRFEKAGMKAEICDIRNIRWDGKNCYTESGMKIDLIYRRAVTSDIMAHYDEVGPFISAVKSDSVCLVGDLRTQIAHNKKLFQVLHLSETMNLLEPFEQAFIKAHVPMTVLWSSETLAARPGLLKKVLENKNGWILKPEDLYGSKGVSAGVECTDAEWEDTVRKRLDTGFILQEFVEPYRTPNIDILAGSDEWITTSNLTGLYVYNGRFYGMYSRVSFDKIISTQYNEMSLPTVIIDL